MKPGSLVKNTYSFGYNVWIEEYGMILALLDAADQLTNATTWSKIQVLFGEKVRILWRFEVELVKE